MKVYRKQNVIKQCANSGKTPGFVAKLAIVTEHAEGSIIIIIFFKWH